MNSQPSLTVCAVTINRERIEEFLEHHSPAGANPIAEWLIFCEEEMAAPLAARWSEKFASLHFVADRATVAINAKRNVLLARAQGRCIIFLDDDALIENPVDAIPKIIAAAQSEPWLIFTICFRNGEKRQILPPDPFRTAHPGSAIEWNQAFQVEALQRAGGWNPLFGPGGKWPSGEAFTLMFALMRAGFHQQPCPAVVVSHPAQAVEYDLPSLGKFRRYRRAVGSVLLYLRPQMSGLEFAAWVGRVTAVTFCGAFIALASGDIPLALLRLLCPLDVFLGMLDFEAAPDFSSNRAPLAQQPLADR